MRRLSLEEIHSYEVGILKEFVHVCEEKKLQYYLAGGTLLGAARHQGFIPWDDDIDILMPRHDYDKFLQYAEIIERNGIYKVAACELGNLNYPFCKIFDTRTHIEKIYIEDPTEQNLWIDILPLDGLPDNDKEVAKIFRKSLLARRILKIQKSKIGTGTTLMKRIVKPILKIFMSVIGIKRTVNYINKLSRTYKIENCNYIGGIAMGYGPQEKMPKKEYLCPKKMNFEGMQLNVPGCWEYYLRALYGDFMKMPPIEEQVAHPMSIWIEEE